MAEHFMRDPHHENRAVTEDGRDVMDLHLTLGPPAHEFNLIGRKIVAAHNGRGSIIFLPPLTHDQIARPQLCAQRSAGVGGRVLNVRPIDVPAGKFEVGFN